MRVLRFDRIQIRRDQMRRREGDGALVIPGKFARTGLQSYEQGDGSVRVELRSEEEVSKSAPLFAGVTVTDEHPATEMITPSNWRMHCRGHVENPRYDAGWISGDFIISDVDLASKIEAGDRVELSAGYYADFIEEPGSFEGAPYDGAQANILPNHVATLSEGQARAGREARLMLDSTGNQIRPGRVADDGGHRDREEETMDEIEITVGGITYTVKADSAAAQALRKELARTTTLETDLETQRAKADAANAEVETLKAKVVELEDPARIDAAVKARADLVEKARKLAGPKVDVSGSAHEIKARCLTAIGVKDVADRPEAYIDARFDVAIEQASTPAAGPTLGDLADMATPPTYTDHGNPSDPLAELDRALDGYCDRAMGREKEVN